MASGIDISGVRPCNAIGGHDPALFKVDDVKLHCHLCKWILHGPMQMECGSLFCAACINQYICDQKDDIVCPDPSCREKFIRGSITPNPGVDREVNESIAICPHCPEEMEFQNLNRHLEDTCLYAVCPHKEYGCESVMLKEELGSHITGCVFKPVECYHCGKMIACGRMKKHQQKCKKKKQTCPNKCGTGKIHQSKMTNHLECECQLSIVDCEYKKYGCQFKVTKRRMADHMKSMTTEHNLKKFFAAQLTDVEMAHQHEMQTNRDEMKSLKRKLVEMDGRLAKCISCKCGNKK